MTPLTKFLEIETESPSLHLKTIVEPILSHLNAVEERLESIALESEGILKDSSKYVLCGGGKRFRAALILFCSSISKNPKPTANQTAIDLAVAAELIHVATLVHDDMIDRAVLRRLKPTAHVQFGEEVAVLLGDFLYAKAFEIITQVGDPKITGWMAESTRKMCEGELDQFRYRYRVDLSLEHYLSFIERKTAAFISVCARSGARLASCTLDEEMAMASFGMNIGISFQIVDDLLDIVGVEKKMGKTLHTDVGNGKMTYPFIVLIESLKGLERESLIKDLQSPSLDPRKIQLLMDQHQIAKKTERFASDYFLKAVQAIECFDVSVKIPLEKLSRFVLKRDH